MTASEPKIGTSKVYTKVGDKGKTSLVAGERVHKSDQRLEAYGTVDELNCVIGILRVDIAGESILQADINVFNELMSDLTRIQNELFDLGGHLACEDLKLRASLPSLTVAEVARLEARMDLFSTTLRPLQNFILPGGSRPAATAHLARTVCRRAERATVLLMELNAEAVEAISIQYLNRLSDYFFVLSRHLNSLMGVDEPIWAGKSGR